MSDEVNAVVRHSRLTWFDDFQEDYERPQCHRTGCLFISVRDRGVWNCWKHGDFVVTGYPKAGDSDATQQQRLVTDGGTDDTGDRRGVKCYECERRFRRSAIHMREIIISHDEGLGYEEVPVPMCRDCEGRRFGFECPQCGIRHDDKYDAMYCCRRAPGEAPDCPECGRRMARVSWGATASGEPTCEAAECEDCGVFWGKFTGFDMEAEV